MPSSAPGGGTFTASTSLAERPPLSGQAAGHSVGRGTLRGQEVRKGAAGLAEKIQERLVWGAVGYTTVSTWLRAWTGKCMAARKAWEFLATRAGVAAAEAREWSSLEITLTCGKPHHPVASLDGTYLIKTWPKFSKLGGFLNPPWADSAPPHHFPDCCFFTASQFP